MSNDDGVTTFSGFGTWMSSLTPAPESDTAQVHEMPAETSQPYYNTHHISELPAEVIEPSPAPAPAPVPAPNPSPPPVRHEVHGDGTFGSSKIDYEPIKPDPLVRLVVKGLKKPNADILFQEVIEVPLFCSLHHVNEALLKKGYKPSVGFGFIPSMQPNLHPKSLPIAAPIEPSEGMPEWPVFVTDGPSCYDPKEGLRINRKETLAEYCSRLQIQVRCIDSQLVINNDLRIAFHRTLRVPEDERTHNLPASFGRFPLQNVAAYSNKLKKSNNPSLLDMAKKSGVFFTMYQREAMWISFQVAPTEPASEYAIRVFAGGINVVSGRKWDLPEPLSRRKQDYVLVPPQKHLDGIAISSDSVRQFIAMPIGSGYSIEKQMTGKEDVGGIQIEINPTAAKLVIRLQSGNWATLEPSGANAVDYGISSGSEIFLVQDGNGKVVMGGQPEEKKYILLRELIEGILVNNTYTITALYPTKLKVTIPSRFSKQTVITKEFSPFAKLKEVAQATKVSNVDISSYNLSLAPKTPWLQPLSLSSTLIGAGIISHEGLPATKSDLPMLTATKPDSKAHAAVNPTYSEPSRLKKHRLSSMFKSSDSKMASLEFQSAPSPGPQMQPYQSQYQEMSTNQYPAPSQYASPSKSASDNQYSSPSSYSTPTYSLEPGSVVFGSAPQSPEPQGVYYGSAQQQSYAPNPQPSYAPNQQPSYTPSPQPSYAQSPQPSYAQTQSPQQSYAPNTYAAQYNQQAVNSTPHSYGAKPVVWGSSPPSQSLSSLPRAHQSPKAPTPREDAWTMGIAAGGKLRQQILPDNDIYRMSRWNKAATSMISIQVLNSVAYEAITGMIAPPTPITLQNYLSAGIPFFSSYQSGQAAQISGTTNFKVIKSVSEMDTSLGVDDGVSVAASQRVACSSCRRNLCDCVLRPCNHAFCSTCVYSRMNVRGKKVVCHQCDRVAVSILGFSAPMSLPGEEVVIPKDVPVVILPGLTGIFGSLAELG